MAAGSSNVFLSLGSNQGDSVAFLLRAREKLSEYVVILAATPEVRTPPWGKTDQPDFLNQVIKVKTALSPHELLDVIHRIESELGRVRSKRWGPRTIDIDILRWGNKKIADEQLIVPHPRLTERTFLRDLLALFPVRTR